MQSTLLEQLENLSGYPRAQAITEVGPDFQVLLKQHKISELEYETLRQIVGRTPTLAELGVFSAMWSEHCSYKSSKIHLKKLPVEGSEVVVGPGENAGVVRLSGKLCVAFKMESHNHPSYIEPYQGAATGVGGILRDVFCMGARPIANLNALKFGRRSHPRTHYLFANVVKGIGDYGNCVGIPTVAGSVAFDASYDGNILVNAMSVGLIHEDKIFKGFASGLNNLVVYVGSATGRDGIHGASMASGSFSIAESGSRSTVQVGDPFAEKLVMEATLEVLEKGLVVGLQDMGAAGLTSSAFEMADRAGNGLYLNLDYVPTRAKDLSAYEILLSESQERMLLCVKPDQWPALQTCLNRWDLAFAVIGIVTDSRRMQICKNGILEVDVAVAPLAEQAPRYNRPYILPSQDFKSDLRLRQQLATLDLATALGKILAEDGFKDTIYSQYDHHIGTKTILGPEAEGAGLLWIRSSWANPTEKNLGLAVSTACNERYTAQDPFLGAAHAVLKCFRSIAATGAKALAVTDCLNYGNPEIPEVMGHLVAGIDGIGLACRELGTPIVSGNVSLYNQTDGKSIAPTPMIGMIGKHSDIRFGLPAVLNGSHKLYLLRPKEWRLGLGGSLLVKVMEYGATSEGIPIIDWEQEREAAAIIAYLALAAKLAAARDVGAGGILTTVVKMCLAHQGLGLSLQLAKTDMEPGLLWFGECAGTYILAAKTDLVFDSDKLIKSEIVPLGQSNDQAVIQFDAIKVQRSFLEAKSRASLNI